MTSGICSIVYSVYMISEQESANGFTMNENEKQASFWKERYESLKNNLALERDKNSKNLSEWKENEANLNYKMNHFEYRINHVREEREEEKREKIKALERVEQLKLEMEKAFELNHLLKEENKTFFELNNHLKDENQKFLEQNKQLHSEINLLRHAAEEQLLREEEARRKAEERRNQRDREKLLDANATGDQLKLVMNEIHAKQDGSKRLTVNRLVRLVNSKQLQNSIKRTFENPCERAISRCRSIRRSKSVINQLQEMKELKEDVRVLKSHERLIKSLITGEYYQITNVFSKSILQDQGQLGDEKISDAINKIRMEQVEQDKLDLSEETVNQKIGILRKRAEESGTPNRAIEMEITNFQKTHISKMRDDVSDLFGINHSLSNKINQPNAELGNEIMLEYVGGLITDQQIHQRIAQLSDGESKNVRHYFKSIAYSIERDIDLIAKEYHEVNPEVL